MNKEQARQLLNEHRDGIVDHPIIAVTRALWVCGDLARTPQKYHQPPVEYGFYQRIQSSHMAQGERVGE